MSQVAIMHKSADPHHVSLFIDNMSACVMYVYDMTPSIPNRIPISNGPCCIAGLFCFMELLANSMDNRNELVDVIGRYRVIR